MCLTDEQKYENKIRFLNLLTELNIDLTNLTKYLDHTNYFEKPATSQYYGSYAGGLCEHALKVYEELYKLANIYCPGKYEVADIIKVALFKDIYKAELFEAYNRNVKNETTGKWEHILDYRVKKERPVFGDLGFSSYMIAKYFIDLNDEQIEAICHSVNIDNTASASRDVYEVMRSYPLVTLTHLAEIAAAYIEEPEEETEVTEDVGD